MRSPISNGSWSCSSRRCRCFVSLFVLVLLSPSFTSTIPKKSTSSGGNGVSSIRLVSGKEIVATNEWTRIGENDTIDAGMHVRIDMTTGEKWVKLPDSSDDSQVENEKKKEGSLSNVVGTTTADSSGTGVVSVTSNAAGSAVPVRVSRKDTISTTNDDGTTKKHQQTNQKGYDFDVMYRTLSQLPEDEKIAMGLPSLPGSSSSSGSGDDDGAAAAATRAKNAKDAEEERKVFEEKMTKIWEYRQEQLRKIQEELVADLPKLLMERIDTLKRYTDDPAYYIQHLLIQKQQRNDPTDNGDDDEDDGTVQSANILSILTDLEYHLSDVDMARDFHTMGGWSLLASFLADDVHHHNDLTVVASNIDNETDTSSTSWVDGSGSIVDNSSRIAVRQLLKREVQMIIDTIQMNVAWALGTAVKNTGEFTPYVIEKIQFFGTTDENTTKTTIATTTPLDLVIQQIERTIDAITENNNNEEIDSSEVQQGEEYRLLQHQKLDKLLYCLGSFLRGNRRAQIHFGAANGGPVLLRKTLLDLLSNSNRNKNKNNSSSSSSSSRQLRIKMIQRLVQLAADVVTEVTTIQQKYDHPDPTIAAAAVASGSTIMSPEISAAIVQSFTTSTDWCSAIAHSLNPKLVFPETTTRTSEVITDSGGSSNTEWQGKVLYSEIALSTATTLAPYCLESWQTAMQQDQEQGQTDTIPQYIAGWINEWDAALSVDDAKVRYTLDPDRYHELLVLAQTLNKMFLSTTAAGSSTDRPELHDTTSTTTTDDNNDGEDNTRDIQTEL